MSNGIACLGEVDVEVAPSAHLTGLPHTTVPMTPAKLALCQGWTSHGNYFRLTVEVGDNLTHVYFVDDDATAAQFAELFGLDRPGPRVECPGCGVTSRARSGCAECIPAD